MEEFKDRLKQARLEMGWTQSKLAEKLHVEPSAITRWEKGGGIEATRMPRIAEVLGKSVEWLLGKNTVSLEKRMAELEAKFSTKTPSPSEVLSTEERNLLAGFRTISPARQREILTLIQNWSASDQSKKNSTRSRG